MKKYIICLIGYFVCCFQIPSYSQTHDLPFIISNGISSESNRHFAIIGEYMVEKHDNSKYRRGVGFIYMLPQSKLINPMLCDDIEIEIYPNPTVSLTTLYYDAPSLGTLHLNYFNEIGKNMGDEHFALSPGLNKLSLDFTRFGAGVYYLQLLFGNLACTKRVVKISP